MAEQGAGQKDKGRVALVTGASRGAGRGIARGFGELGYTVYVTGRTVALRVSSWYCAESRVLY